MARGSLPNGLNEDPEGRYANCFNAGHNAFEVILEFAQFYEGDVQPRVHTRIVTSPAYAKTFLEVLRESLERYQAVYGSIVPGKSHE